MIQSASKNLLAVLLSRISIDTYAAASNDFLDGYAKQEASNNSNFKGFDANRGHKVFDAEREDWSWRACMSYNKPEEFRSACCNRNAYRSVGSQP